MKTKLNRMWRQVTADKKKFGILCSMVAVGLLLWGRLILLEDVPKIATADPNAAAQPAQTPDGQAEVADTSAPVLPPLPAVAAALSEDLTLNLFAFRHNRYKPLPTEESEGNGSQLTGSTDDERKRELVELARSLRLQSVIQGASPAIVINGEVLRVGDSIEGFEVVSFEEGSAILTRDGLKFKLMMWPK
ncbi:MAG: hypothetical protein AAF085_02135 [Planctomycetota bacterium]